MTTERERPVEAQAFLESLIGPMTLGKFLAAIREGEGWSLEEMGKKLGISRAHLCDIEKERRVLSPERAARFAKVLGYSEVQMVQLALQDLVNKNGLHFLVDVKPAEKKERHPPRKVSRVRCRVLKKVG